MFTGIVERTACVRVARRTADGLRLTVRVEALPAVPDLPAWRAVEIGESIAVSGVCLTAVASTQRGDHDAEVSFEAVPETLSRTTLGRVSEGEAVNLERSLRVGDSFGGHYVTGHVDTVGRVVGREVEGDQTLFTIGIDAAYVRQLIPKGSIAVDGVSLTVIDVDATACFFTFAAFPHTLARTTLGGRSVDDEVNIETDAFGKWVLHALEGVRPWVEGETSR